MDVHYGLERMILSCSGGGGAVKFDVPVCGETGPAVECNDHWRVDAQEFACSGEGDEIGFRTVAVGGACEGAVRARNGRLRSVREQEYLRT